VIILDQSVARALPVFLIDSTDHVTPKTGIAEGSVTVKISKNLGTLTAFTLTGLWTEIGQGLYKIAFASGDLDTIGFFGYLVTATDCDQYSGMMYVDDLPTNVDTLISDVAATHVHAAGAETEATAAHGHASTIDGHITADYGATEKACVDLLDDAAGGLADIHTDVGTVAGYVDKIDDATDGLTAIKAEVEGLGGAAMRGTDNAALASVCTEARLAELGATNIPADIDAILADTGTDGVVIPQAQADKVWGTATRALTDKADFTLSSAGIQAIWDKLTSALTTVGSIGKLLVDDINATISSRSSHTAADVWAVATRTLTSFGTLAQDIWDKLTSGLTTVGSIGKLLVDDINATISSRAPEAGGNVAAIKAKTDLIGASVALESGGNLAAVKAQTDLIPADITTQLDTNVPAIKAKTDLLPADTATQLDTNIPAIKAKTDLIPADIATQLDTNIPAVKAKTDLIGASVALESGGNLAAVKAQTDKFLFDVSNFVKSIAQNSELARLDVDVSSRETPAHVTLLANALSLQIYDLITRAKGLNEIYDSVALRALEATLTAIKGVGWTDETLKAIKDAISGGTDPQAIRDSMKLAPSAGAPAAESIDKHLDDLVSGEEPSKAKFSI
jgi:hypothetical protein